MDSPQPKSRIKKALWVAIILLVFFCGIPLGLLLPAIGRAKQAAKLAQAKNEMVNLSAAIGQYNTEYAKSPVPPNRDSLSDFTFGTFGTSDAGVGITNASGYQANNSELMAILMDIQEFDNGHVTINAKHTLNPRNIVTFTAKMTGDTNSPGLGIDGVLRDPWGHPYIITIPAKGQVTIWSFGPDGKADPSIKPDQGVNKDNVLSWQ